jgi:hypothetical protein
MIKEERCPEFGEESGSAAPEHVNGDDEDEPKMLVRRPDRSPSFSAVRRSAEDEEVKAACNAPSAHSEGQPG